MISLTSFESTPSLIHFLGMKPEPTQRARNGEPQEKSPSLHASIRDGVSYSVMAGCAENYFGAFGIFLKATTLQVGLLASLPQLFGAVMQWVGAVRTDRFRSRRKIVIAGGVAQAPTLIPMALLPFLFGKGRSSGPFPHPARTRLLWGQRRHRSRLEQPDRRPGAPIHSGPILRPPEHADRHGHLLLFLLAGLALQGFDQAGFAASGFCLCFLVAFLARMNSVRWLTRHEDPHLKILPDHVFTFRQFLRRSRHSNFGKFVFFVGAINFGVAFSAPYFALYMLRDLGFSYVEYTLVTATAIITQFLTFRYWGGLSDRFGNKKILNVCGWGVAVLPIFWVFPPWIPYLLMVQTFGGFVWSGFSLAAANFLFDAVTPPKRARCVAYQGLVNGFCMFFGSLAGGFAAVHLPQSFSLGPWTWTPAFILPVIFLISGLIRVGAASVLLRKFKEVRPVEPIRHGEFLLRVSHLKPIRGAILALYSGVKR